MSLYPTLIFLIMAFKLISAQKPSPCPDIFVYEVEEEEDRWYARVSLTTNAPLTGVWLRIQLDQPAEVLGNWFGDTSSTDNKEFLIKNRDYKLEANREPLSIRFFVKYNTAGSVPSIIGVRLNGKTICPTSVGADVTTSAPQLFISNSKTNSSNTPSSTARSVTSTRTPPSDEEDDFFAGDFSPIRRPVIPILIDNPGIPATSSCGMVKINARPLITYGQDTIEGEWPWHAALYRSKGINLQYICGGSLISTSHILTAAHCVTKPKTGLPVSADLFTVYLGKYNLYRLGQTVQDKTVSKIVTHPEYNATYFHNDLALLRLENPVQISDFVRTVCLWEEDVNLNSVTEKLGTVVGWGFDQNGNVTENLMQAKMPVVSTETCIFSNRDFFSRFTSAKTYCAGFRNGTSACTGDSGGGMVFPKTGTRGQNSVWQLRGVISLSAALQNERVVCDTSNYIVFTDVAKHLDWIRSAMNKK